MTPQKTKPSRTLEAAKLGMIALIILSAELLICLIIQPDAITSVGEVIGTLSISIACVATGGTVSVGSRHWGAKESSSSSTPKAMP
tara:strand:+ start:2398 stop:2655 length:258 start_codon:yes stop_codon:yes gene_type:complete